MALNVSYQQFYNGIDTLALKAVTRDVLTNSQVKSSNEVKSFGVDLYNGEIDAMTARQVAISGTGLQVTLNNNLETAIKFLQTRAAETTAKTTNSEVVSLDSAKKDKQGSNPFYNGEVADYGKKSEKKEAEYLFITAA